jgi:probable rRNA maturation factor
VSVAVEIENRTGWSIDVDAARRVVGETLTAEGLSDGEVGVIFVSPGEMAELNRLHRGTPSPTDVLSFPIDGRGDVPSGLPRQLGDVVVCPEVAAGDSTPIAVLLVHGALHLVGYDHERDGGEMLSRQAVLVREARDVDAEPA